MDFQVPQFIEREPKIIGPLTFKQFIVFAILGGVSFVLYFSLPKTIFYPLVLILFGVAGALMLIKKEGFPLYVIIERSFLFLFSPKLYLWREKEIMTSVLKENPPEIASETGKREKSPLNVTDKGRLNNIFIKVETGKK